MHFVHFCCCWSDEGFGLGLVRIPVGAAPRFRGGRGAAMSNFPFDLPLSLNFITICGPKLKWIRARVSTHMQMRWPNGAVKRQLAAFQH